MNYKINREAKEGFINKKNIIKAATIVTAIGIISAGILHVNSKESDYAYNKNYTEYSKQLEDMMNVDINENYAALLDQLQTYREAINSYREGDGLIDRGDYFKELANNYDEMIDTCLDIAKTSIASENGGSINEWTIRLEKTDGTWSAINSNQIAITLDGEVRDLVDAISNVQSYDKQELYGLENPEGYIDHCEKMIEEAGKVVVDKSTKSK